MIVIRKEVIDMDNIHFYFENRTIGIEEFNNKIYLTLGSYRKILNKYS